MTRHLLLNLTVALLFAGGWLATDAYLRHLGIT